MAIWLFRAGKYGEYEDKFLREKRIFLTWDNLNIDLSKYNDRQALFEYLSELYDDVNKNTIRNWIGQIYTIAHKVEIDDWVILPSKLKSSIHIGKIIGKYKYDAKAENPFFHYREVDWFAKDIPRSNFDQDILYSLGAFMTICQIHRNNAEKRIKEMSQNNWIAKNEDIHKGKYNIDDKSETDFFNLEEVSNDQISKLIIRKFKGHKMESLIEAILKAKGYTTYHSGIGPDNGVDILAALEPMGFGDPKLCVQVKSTNSSVGMETVDQLLGVIHKFNASQGLLVSWGGFKSTVEKEAAKNFFKIRLWDQKDIINNFLKNYEKLNDEIKAEIPLKKIWILPLSENL